MSEYQYYEFRAVDRLLTKQEMAEVRELSTRAEITPTSFTNHYDWGDFRGDPDKLVDRYYDAFLYLANWGTRRVMLRLPRRLLAEQVVAPYFHDEFAHYRATREHLVLEYVSQEEGGDWVETGEEVLVDVLPVRDQLARGDLRALYLGFLLEAQDDDLRPDLVEPPVPAGLGDLGPALSVLADFLRIGQDLIAVAAEASKPLVGRTASNTEIHAWLASLPPEEKDDHLLRLMLGADPRLSDELLQKYERSRGSASGPESGRRTVRELLDAAKRHERERLRREAEQEAAERDRELDQLLAREAEAWVEVGALLDLKRPSEYEQVVRILRDLRDLAAREGRAEGFAERLAALRERYRTRAALLRQMETAKL